MLEEDLSFVSRPCCGFIAVVQASKEVMVENQKAPHPSGFGRYQYPPKVSWWLKYGPKLWEPSVSWLEKASPPTARRNPLTDRCYRAASCQLHLVRKCNCCQIKFLVSEKYYTAILFPRLHNLSKVLVLTRGFISQFKYTLSWMLCTLPHTPVLGR